MPDILTGVLGWVTALFTDQTDDAAETPTLPGAYINYIFFDEQFQVAKDATENLLAGYSRVGNKNEVYLHTDLTGKIAPKNGYAYIAVYPVKERQEWFSEGILMEMRAIAALFY